MVSPVCGIFFACWCKFRHTIYNKNELLHSALMGEIVDFANVTLAITGGYCKALSWWGEWCLLETWWGYWTYRSTAGTYTSPSLTLLLGCSLERVCTGITQNSPYIICYIHSRLIDHGWEMILLNECRGLAKMNEQGLESVHKVKSLIDNAHVSVWLF